jgi:predicted dehydrogenase
MAPVTDEMNQPTDGSDESSLPAFCSTPISRQAFLRTIGLGAAAIGLGQAAQAAEKPIQGFEKSETTTDTAKGWVPISDRKIRVGIAGYGVCQFGAAFGFQDHPNVEVVAVTDLIPERCAGLAKACRCAKTYPSLEEMVKDDKIEAVFVATDAPSHARHCIEVLKRGKHVASAVPAVFGSLEQADQLLEAVKTSGRKYMMFETSSFHQDLHAMRQIYNAGKFGKLVYSEGEYFHYCPEPIDSYKGWRIGLPPQWYPTHSNAYYVCVTGGSFTEVSCQGMPSEVNHCKPANNPYKNPFGTEIALFRTSEGGMSRMAVSWDTPGLGGEMGRVRGQKGSFYGTDMLPTLVRKEGGAFDGSKEALPNMERPPLPPGVAPGSHGGSHGYLTDEFISAILQDRKPLVDIVLALNMTVSGIVAHQSALKDGERMKIPQYKI